MTFSLDSCLVLRPPAVPNALRSDCEALSSSTIYRRGARVESAPSETDCLTAVAYLFRGLLKPEELDWIGNMPGRLTYLVEKRWTVEGGICAGDLIFLTGRQGAIQHVAVALSANEVFHSAGYLHGGKIQTLEHVLSRYNCIQNRIQLLKSRDRRRGTWEPPRSLPVSRPWLSMSYEQPASPHHQRNSLAPNSYWEWVSQLLELFSFVPQSIFAFYQNVRSWIR